jgi:hypothetical protein
MDPAALGYLQNVAELSVTFAAVTILLPVVRQIKGGRLSAADIHLLMTFMTAGFVTALTALLPGMVGLLTIGGGTLWMIASGGAALLHGVAIVRIQMERRQLSMDRAPSMVIVGFASYWLAIVTFALNALPLPVQGVGPHSLAVTLCLGTSMWLFVRRIGTLRSGRSDEDWNLRAN